MASRTIRILGRIFKIARETDPANYGQCIRDKAVIKINPEQDDFSLKDTYLHEVMHAILHQQGYNHPYKLEESFVRPLATGIVTVLQDNPAFARWLISKAKV